MPIHYSSGGFGDFAGAAGQAADPVARQLESINTRVLRQQQQDKLLEQRRAIATERLAQRDAENARAQMESFQKGLSKALAAGAELGFETDFDGFRALDDTLRSLDPDVYAQIASASPFPSNANDLSFPTAFMLRAEAVKGLRALQGAEAKMDAWGAFEREAELSGYTEEEIASVLSLRDEPDVSAEEFLLEAEQVREAARGRARDQAEQEYVTREAQELARKNPAGLRDQAMSDLWSRLVTGQSENPRKDMAKLRIGLSEGVDVLGEIEADAYSLGTMAGQQAALERAERSIQEFVNGVPFAADVPLDSIGGRGGAIAEQKPMQQPAPGSSPIATGGDEQPSREPRQRASVGGLNFEGLDGLYSLFKSPDPKMPTPTLHDQLSDELEAKGVEAETEMGRLLIKQFIGRLDPWEREHQFFGSDYRGPKTDEESEAEMLRKFRGQDGARPPLEPIDTSGLRDMLRRRGMSREEIEAEVERTKGLQIPNLSLGY